MHEWPKLYPVPCVAFVIQYMGRWYEIARIPTIYQVDQYCNSATYTLKDDGHVEVINAGLDK